MPAKFDPEKQHRRSIRLKGYDYSQAGAYYVTIVTWQREHLFGEVINGEMILNELGQIARSEWFKTAELRPYVELIDDEFVIMPNHGHGIIWIADAGVGAVRRTAPTLMDTPFTMPEKQVAPGSLGAIVRAYKSAVTYAINAARDTRGLPVWQRNYYEHVIRNEQDYQAKRDYILSNPANWGNDDENQM